MPNGLKEKAKREARKKADTLYKKIAAGEITPEGSQRGWLNLEAGHQEHNFSVMDKEKQKEISRKGAAAANQLRGEKKTAKESLERILTLKIDDNMLNAADLAPELAQKLRRDNPNATLYDLIQAVAAGKAVQGSIKAAEYIRDTHGDKPTDKLQIDGAEIITEKDRALLERIAGRLNDPDIVIAATIDGEKETGKEPGQKGSDTEE